jgi:hypothetical protein
MNGFAASGRVERSSPRLVRQAADRETPIEAMSPDHPELVEVRTADPLVDRWAAFRARWSGLTFYLFDPQSWRR